MVENNPGEITSIKKKHKPAATMVPLFSLRTLKAVGIGVVVGAVLGLAYWFVSPMFSSPVWQSSVYVQIVNPGSSYVLPRDLQQRGEYYAGKAKSLPFYEFLSQELSGQEPDHAYSAGELNQMISATYNQYSATPGFNIVVSTASSDETAFLASKTPQAFVDYLITEDREQQQKTYQDTLDASEKVKSIIVDSQQELDAYQAKIAASDVQNNPTYIALNAKIAALEAELRAKANELITLSVSDNTDGSSATPEQVYQQTLEQANSFSEALAKAQQELSILEKQRGNTEKDVTIIAMDAKIRALQLELDKYMVGYEDTSGETPFHVPGLAELIANENTSSATYTNTLKKVNAISTALAEAKEELAILQGPSSDNISLEMDYQLAQAKVQNLNTQLIASTNKLAQLGNVTEDTNILQETQAAFDRISANLTEAKNQITVLESQGDSSNLEEKVGAQIARAKIANFNTELTSLNTQLASLAGNVGTTPAANYLAAGKPSTPVHVASTTPIVSLLFGIIIGICGAWAVLNFRWIIKVLSSSPEEEA